MILKVRGASSLIRLTALFNETHGAIGVAPGEKSMILIFEEGLGRLFWQIFTPLSAFGGEDRRVGHRQMATEGPRPINR